ncbi:MAG: hypothetical protein HYT63_00045 [Candidatus Yanofskybacteria bacterium]|nr:hypothetical protein [Candidatus Yanofskybacteria bacterium]
MLDWHSVLEIFHLLGVVVAMGAAITGDFGFFSSIRNRKISATEMRFIKLASRTVWLGLVLIIISGVLLFAQQPERYLQSGKFLAKMSIVGVIIVNGLIFHFVHLPRLKKHIGLSLTTAGRFSRQMSGLMVSGAVSSVSWFSALVLGALGRLPYAYREIMLVYLGLLVVAISTALLLKNKIFSTRNK